MTNIYYHTNKHVTTVITVTKEPYWGSKSIDKGTWPVVGWGNQVRHPGGNVHDR